MTFFTIPGKPQGKARARTVYNPAIHRTVSYTPDNTMLYENLVKTMYLKCKGQKFMDGQPLRVSITAFYEPPKSTSKKRQKIMLEGYEKPCKKPDIDNIVKVILDALNGIAYRDDTQVVSLSCQKRYAEESRVEVEIESMVGILP